MINRMVILKNLEELIKIIQDIQKEMEENTHKKDVLMGMDLNEVEQLRELSLVETMQRMIGEVEVAYRLMTKSNEEMREACEKIGKTPLAMSNDILKENRGNKNDR